MTLNESLEICMQVILLDGYCTRNVSKLHARLYYKSIGVKAGRDIDSNTRKSRQNFHVPCAKNTGIEIL